MRFNHARPCGAPARARRRLRQACSTTTPADRRPGRPGSSSTRRSAHGSAHGAYDALQSLSYYGLDVGDARRPAGGQQHLGRHLPVPWRHREQQDRRRQSGGHRHVDGDLPADRSRQRHPRSCATGCRRSTMPRGRKSMGEAYFLRALSYHNLVKFWGAVPMPLAPVTVGGRRGQVHAHAGARGLHADPQGSGQCRGDDQRIRVIRAARRQWRCRRFARECCSIGRASRARTRPRTTRRHSIAANAVLAGRDTLTVPFKHLFTANGADTDEDIFRVSFTPRGVQRAWVLLAVRWPSGNDADRRSVRSVRPDRSSSARQRSRMTTAISTP